MSAGVLVHYRRETPALVGVITRHKDWQLLFRQHWYRIPLRSAPEGLAGIRYLAFYQTKAFGAQGWAINYYAPVKGITTVRRRDLLPDEYRHPRADELYYRIAIGELTALSRPIPSRRLRRIVFIPTSLERLLHAREINDLFRTSPLEDLLHHRLQNNRLPAERQYLVHDGDRHYFLDFALFCTDGKLNVECDGDRYHSGREQRAQERQRDNRLTAEGWQVLRFSGRELQQNPAECLRLIRKTVHRLGGISDRAIRRPGCKGT